MERIKSWSEFLFPHGRSQRYNAQFDEAVQVYESIFALNKKFQSGSVAYKDNGKSKKEILHTDAKLLHLMQEKGESIFIYDIHADWEYKYDDYFICIYYNYEATQSVDNDKRISISISKNHH